MIENPKFTIYGSQIQEWMENIQKLKQERNKLQKKCDKLNNNTIELKRKAEAFDKILDINIDRDELLSEEYIEKVNDVVQQWISS